MSNKSGLDNSLDISKECIGQGNSLSKIPPIISSFHFDVSVNASNLYFLLAMFA